MSGSTPILPLGAGNATATAMETLRQQFRPSRVRFLLVGESPPANRTFFYRGDSKLCHFTRQAFEAAFGVQFETGQRFLTSFKDLGFYLEDLEGEPINALDESVRKRLRLEAVEPLAVRIRDYAPEFVVALMKSIHRYVREAAALAGVPEDHVYALPFPAHGKQRQFVEELATLLRDFAATGIVQR